ncbi:MAG TPA: 50S ribosomal protein L11 methyltransferase [Chitinophagaceae bacterium]|nr:50S ribosomal protein L11 methyltransferase [Chitinophagaceae bacterium]
MGNYIQISFDGIQSEQQELLIAFLSEAGYEGFEENDNVLSAYIEEKNFDKVLLNELVYKYQLTYTEQLIPQQNWNKFWESNFQPVVVEDFVAIRANFHAIIPGVKYEIVITPKMSFGTGHHATTYMMIQQMRELDFTGKSVFDFGTGTGVLAILAEKLGASGVLAIDNDEWSIENAQENISYNKCLKIQAQLSDTFQDTTKYDIILANINRNVILGNAKSIASSLKENGRLLLSGLLEEDETAIREFFNTHNLFLRKKYSKNSWISLLFSR